MKNLFLMGGGHKVLKSTSPRVKTSLGEVF